MGRATAAQRRAGGPDRPGGARRARPSTAGSTTRCRRRWPPTSGWAAGSGSTSTVAGSAAGWSRTTWRRRPGCRPSPWPARAVTGHPPPVVSLAEWAAWRWAGPLSSFLGHRLPPPGGPGRPGPAPAGPGTGRRSTAGAPAAVARRGLGGASSTAPWAGRAGRLLGGPAGPGARRHAGGAGADPPDRSRRRPGAGAVAARAEPAGARLRRRGRRRGPHARRVGAGRRRAPVWWSGPGPRRGPRSRRLRAAVVLDAHDEAYREERSPTWSAVDVVVERGRRDGAPVVLVTACPPVAMTEGRPAGHHRPAGRAAGLADGRGGRPHRRRSPHRPVLRATGPAAALGARPARRPGGVHPQPDRPGPAAGLCPVRGAGPVHAVRGSDGPGRGGRRPAVPAVRRDPPGGVRRVRLHPAQVAPDRGHPGHRGASALTGVDAVEVTGVLGRPTAGRAPGWWSGPRPPSTG